jgi:hypothetical protein
VGSGPNLFHQRAGTWRRHRAINFRNVGGTSGGGIIHHVHRIALVDKIIRPAGATVGRLDQAVRTLASTAGYEDDGIRVLDVLRHPYLDIHRTVHRFLPGSSHPLAAYIEMALAADIGGGESRDGRRRSRARSLGGLPYVRRKPAGDHDGREQQKLLIRLSCVRGIHGRPAWVSRLLPDMRERRFSVCPGIQNLNPSFHTAILQSARARRRREPICRRISQTSAEHSLRCGRKCSPFRRLL